jgi:hypothetical protein
MGSRLPAHGAGADLEAALIFTREAMITVGSLRADGRYNNLGPPGSFSIPTTQANQTHLHHRGEAEVASIHRGYLRPRMSNKLRFDHQGDQTAAEEEVSALVGAAPKKLDF